MIAIQVFGETYLIVVDKIKGSVLGLCDPLTCTITLHSDLLDNEEHLWRILRHELGHAFLFETGLAETLNTREQEMLAQLFGNFLQLFDKPPFIANIIAEAKR